ncbi:hypothetical protein [Neisseria mucosa]|uniref:hypothetical protein n=1 Tax=Neisseria mucosa TaxID=488 RepID=UPI001FD04607|nr:hypothetical protein [Neisseria mucosa]
MPIIDESKGRLSWGYGRCIAALRDKNLRCGYFVETCFVVYFPRDAAFDIALGIAAADDVAVVGINGKAFGLDRRGGRAPRVRKNLNLRQPDDPRLLPLGFEI